MSMQLIGAIALLVLGVAAASALAGHWRFRARAGVEVSTLFAGAAASVGADQVRARRDSLPEPVRRYLRYAIPAGAPAIRTARLKHDGFLRSAPGSRWARVSGEEYFTAAKPGFVWHATAWPAPLLWFEARDRLLSGRGEMLVKLCSALTLVEASGAELDQGARLRWLAECVWFPYGFAGDDIQWDPIGPRSARMTLRQDGLPVSAVVEIDDEGKLTRLRAERYREVGGGRAELTPWIARCGDYRAFGGLLVPSSVEISWLLPEGEFKAIRFRVTTLEYNVANRFGRHDEQAGGGRRAGTGVTGGNLSATERAFRTVVGAAMLGAAWSGAVTGVAGAALEIFGWIPLATGLAGWCPFYAVLGFTTRHRGPAERPR
jgi:hypothetical protein